MALLCIQLNYVAVFEQFFFLLSVLVALKKKNKKNSDDSLGHGMDGGSDDDLGMDTYYEYESDSSLEGIQS